MKLADPSTGRKKGTPKTGGRKKGTPNRKLQLIGLREKIEKLWPNYHPIVEMARLANDETATPELRFAANKEVAQYLEPKRKAIEHTGASGIPISVSLSRGEWDDIIRRSRGLSEPAREPLE